MARPRDLDLRQRLLEAATAEFAEKGFAGANLDAIGARAGVTKGGVYFHFDGKEELFFAVLDHWRERRRQALQAQRDAGDGAAALRQFLADYLGFHFHTPAVTHLLRVLATELRGGFTARLREDDRQELRWLRAAIRDLLVLGIRDGSLAVDDPAAVAFVFAAAVTGALQQWHTSAADVEAFCNEEQLANALVARYATGLRRAGGDGGAGGEFDFRGVS